jgi:hypothetical protein
MMSAERRTSPRRRVFKSGRIALNRTDEITSVVRNLSAGGAMLEAANIAGIPDEFMLVIESESLSRQCRVIWRQGARMGIRFL